MGYVSDCCTQHIVMESNICMAYHYRMLVVHFYYSTDTHIYYVGVVYI